MQQNDSRSLGKRISAERTSRGWNQSELARRAEVSVSYLNRLEAGKYHRPSVDKIAAIARVLRLSVSELTEPPPVTAEDKVAVTAMFAADEAPLVAEILQDLAHRSPGERKQILAALKIMFPGSR